MSEMGSHDWGFFKWFAVGFLVVFGFLAGFTIGLPFLFLGLILFAWFSWRGPGWPADLGLLAGAGAVCLVIAVISAISGDIAPFVWAAVGTGLTGIGAGTFWWLRCRPGESPNAS
jgi:hypothetical protein